MPYPSSVSIIIPCYNAERWVAEAIQSCLNQTQPNIEIIVIDDGSTDTSLKVLQQFGSQIKLKSVPNRGGNVARNEGFKLSTGAYIQYLDADDYLLPDKIARQVRFLEESHADVVYGDWRYQFHLPDGFSYLDKVEITGAQDDILESLLSHWWVAPGAILYRRWVVESVGGWDERLRAGQDRDFFTSVAMSSAAIRYQAGCSFVYRKYGETTISTSNIERWFDHHCLSLEKAQTVLSENGLLSAKYKNALAIGFSRMLRFCLPIKTERHFEILRKIQILVPDFKAKGETLPFRLAQSVSGYYWTARLASSIRAAIGKLKLAAKKTILFNMVLWARRLLIMHSNHKHQVVAGNTQPPPDKLSSTS